MRCFNVHAGAPRSLLLLLGGLLLFHTALAVAAEALSAVAIIIDDMGNNRSQGDAALALPGPVTYAFLPFTPHAAALALQAHRQRKQVMVHLPMDTTGGNRLGPGALHLYMDEVEFKQTLLRDIAAIPYAVGVNNHMGSLLTRHPGAMSWLMQGMRYPRPLFFVDSRTTKETVAQAMADELQVPNTRRDVFLDNDRDPQAIRRQFQLLLEKARRQGSAVGIGHPHPETSAVLQQELTTLQARGVQLITVSELIQRQQRSATWHASWSPLRKVAKSSKR